MKNLVPYIVFPGTCKEAMAFYKRCLGGEITMMQTYADSPVPAPEAAQNRIYNSELVAGGVHFKASDDLPGHEVKIGNNISLFVHFSDKEIQRETFVKLSHGGKVLFPIQGPFGMLVDPFGIQWMLVCEDQ